MNRNRERVDWVRREVGKRDRSRGERRNWGNDVSK